MKHNRYKLMFNMILKFGLGFLLIGLILFSCAGSISYINGWIFIIALAVPMAIFGIFLFAKDPAVLERRLSSKEPDKSQGTNVAVGGLMFITSFLLSGLDYRFKWSEMPFLVSLIALIFMLIGYGMYIAVILQNSYASRVVDVFEDQKIITNGLYYLVRHPMYLASLLIYTAMPFILGSWFAVIPMLIYPVILVRRISNEESLLVRKLEGYSEYMKKVKYRLLPFIW